MGLLDDLKRVVHPYDDEDEEFEDDYAEPSRGREGDSFSSDRRSDRRGDDRRGNKVVNISATTQLKVVLVKPDHFENASEIADHLKAHRTVVVNLEAANDAIACRLMDFLTGVAYAGEGKIKKVAKKIYIITPYHVDIVGDLIDELESNGFYI